MFYLVEMGLHILGYTHLHWDWLDFTEFCLVLASFTGLYGVLQGFLIDLIKCHLSESEFFVIEFDLSSFHERACGFFYSIFVRLGVLCDDDEGDLAAQSFRISCCH